MDKIDRLGWAEGMSFTAYGLRVGVRASAPGTMDRLRPLLPPGWKPAGSPEVERLYSLIVGGEGPRPNVRRFNLLYVDATRMARSMDLDAVLSNLESDLQLYIAERARRRLFVHAGVVGWHGQAIVIPGQSMSGKTSLVAALVRAGATYYSDEYAVLDARGRVHPYPTPLSIRERPDARAKKCPPEALGGRPGVGPLPVGSVSVTKYRQGARWRPRQLPPGRALLELLAHTVPVLRRPRAAITQAAKSGIRHAGSQGRARRGRGDGRGFVEPTTGARDRGAGGGSLPVRCGFNRPARSCEGMRRSS